jgi:hypothetical protein
MYLLTILMSNMSFISDDVFFNNMLYFIQMIVANNSSKDQARITTYAIIGVKYDYPLEIPEFISGFFSFLFIVTQLAFNIICFVVFCRQWFVFLSPFFCHCIVWFTVSDYPFSIFSFNNRLLVIIDAIIKLLNYLTGCYLTSIWAVFHEYSWQEQVYTKNISCRYKTWHW